MNPPDTGHLRERLVSHTRDLVLIPSSEERPDELNRAIQWVGNHLESIEGVEVRLFETRGVRSLVARPRQCEAPEVVMFGHVDVVHHHDAADYRSDLRDGRIYGPGTGDMKGVVAILLELFRNFHLDQPGVSLGLAITTDEERGGMNGTRALLDDHGLRCRTAIVPDGGSIDQIVVEEKGILQLQLESAGKSCHTARPWLGTNALQQLVLSLHRIEKLFPPRSNDPHHWQETCSVTRISTPNRSVNRIPNHASAALDIRFPAPQSAAQHIDRITSVLAPGVAVSAIIVAEPSMLDPDPAFFDACRRILGTTPARQREHGGSDARFLTRRQIPVIMSRPLCGQLHSRREWIDISSMLQFYHVYRTYLGERLA